MKASQRCILGFILILVGIAIVISGGFLLFRPNSYAAATVTNAPEDVSWPPPKGNPPIYIEHDFEVIRSQPVLIKVVEQLKLESRYSPKLTTSEAIAALSENMKLRPCKLNSDDNVSRFIEIRVIDKDPSMAASMANAVAEAYREYLRDVEIQAFQKSIAALKTCSSETEHKLKATRDEANRLKEDLHISDPEPENTDSNYPAYAAVKRKMQELQKLLAALETKISASSKPKFGYSISIFKRAKAPMKTVHPNRQDAAILVGLGILISAAGFAIRLLATDRQSTSPPAPQ